MVTGKDSSLVLLDKQLEQKGEKPREFYERMKLQLERKHLKLAFMQWEDLAYLTGLWGETEPSRLRQAPDDKELTILEEWVINQ